MPGKETIVDLSLLNFDNPKGLDEIRSYNPQRFEMEQLTGVVYENLDDQTVVGYKDVTGDEFWVRGHMPNMPLMPGVIMLEAAAQLCSYYVQKNDVLGTKMVGFGGLEKVRFRDPVVPGDRLIIMSKLLKARRKRMVVSYFQGIVGETIVVEGEMKGIPIPDNAIAARLQ